MSESLGAKTKFIPLELQVIDQFPGDEKTHMLMIMEEFKKGTENREAV